MEITDELIEDCEKQMGYSVRPKVPHEWFKDPNFVPKNDRDYISRDLCTCCDAYRYHSVYLKNNEIVFNSTIIVSNTQYPEYGKYAHNCSLIYL